MKESNEFNYTPRIRGKKGRTLLISAPEPFVRDTLKIKLASKGYDVILADSGKETVRIATKVKPTLVLTEIDYNDLDGVRVCQMLKGHRATNRIPIIVLTKVEETPEKKFLFNPYVEDYITKPFSPREVARVVDRVIRDKGC